MFNVCASRHNSSTQIFATANQLNFNCIDIYRIICKHVLSCTQSTQSTTIFNDFRSSLNEVFSQFFAFLVSFLPSSFLISLLSLPSLLPSYNPYLPFCRFFRNSDTRHIKSPFMCIVPLPPTLFLSHALIAQLSLLTEQHSFIYVERVFVWLVHFRDSRLFNL